VIPALVLTAGLGTRLDPLTRLVAKPAVPVGDRTLVERVLDWLRREGVTDVVLNLHHRPETITAILGDGAHLGLRLRYSWERAILGSAGGPRHALPLLDAGTFLVVNGDTLCDVDLAPMIDAHARTGAAATLAVVPNPAPDHYNGILLDHEDRVSGFVPKGPLAASAPGHGPSWHFVGVQVVNADTFAGLPDGVRAETIGGTYRQRVTSDFGSVRAWRVPNRFTDVGTPRDYLSAVLELTATSGVDGSQTPGPARVVRSVIWPGASLADDVELTDCIVAGLVTLPAGFRGHRSVLVPTSCLRPGESVPTIGDVAVFSF
jgi:mannose-1-phosphate guanylyltransferase